MPNLKNGLHHLFIQKSSHFFVQFIRYFFVGGLAFLVDFGMLAFFTEICGFYYVISNTLSFILGVLVNYFLCVLWIFPSSGNKKTEFAYFLLISVIGLIMSNILLWVSTHYIGLYYLMSKIIVSAIVWMWNFLARKYLLFKKT